MVTQSTAAREPAPYELEADAERLRSRIGENVRQLRQQLRPSHLIDEWAESSGIKEMTPEKIFDFTARRHPVQTAVIGAGLGLLVLAALRRSGHDLELSANHPGEARRLSLGDMIGTLTQTATASFREHAAAKRDEALDAAKTHVASAAHDLSETMEKAIDDALIRSPVPAEARPILVSSLQLLAVAATEAVIAKLAGTKLFRGKGARAS